MNAQEVPIAVVVYLHLQIASRSLVEYNKDGTFFLHWSKYRTFNVAFINESFVFVFMKILGALTEISWHLRPCFPWKAFAKWLSYWTNA